MSYRLIFWSLTLASLLSAQTIEEKLASMAVGDARPSATASVSPNRVLSSLRKELHDCYRQSERLVSENASEEQFQELLLEVNRLRGEIEAIENEWRLEQVEEMMNESEECGVWEQEDITLSKLIIEYGSQNYLYIIPQEIAGIKLHLHTSLMIPRESWGELLDGILKYNGVGIKEINSYTKQLYLLKQDLIAVDAILSEKYQLETFDDKTRLVYVYSPSQENLKPAFYFLERFRDPKSTVVYQVGQKIAIVGFKEDVKKLVNLTDTVWENDQQKVTKVVTTSKIQAEEIIKVLKSYFGGLAESNRPVMGGKGGSDLSILPLTREGGLVLIGSKTVVEKAEEIVHEMELQIEDPFELTVFWYTCSHTDPADLADILEKIYTSLIYSGIEGGRSEDGFSQLPELPGEPLMPPSPQDASQRLSPPEPQIPFPPPPPFLESGTPKTKDQKKPYNFIPYPTTGSVLMVVRKDTLGKIKEVIKKLDIPKRMVEIEVLLCERRLKNSSCSGINLLKLGSPAQKKDALGVSYEHGGPSHGIFEFIFSQATKKSFVPAPFDLVYNFLLTQEDIRVSQSPSVITINQTPVVFSITDQISINTGAIPVATDGRVITKDSFERIEFGITLTLIPTVHEAEMDDPLQQLSITLENDIAFENLKGAAQKNDRPDVHKRRIKNHVRIPDGQTIILGGLKSKSSEDKEDSIPFLGEIPGIGKLFGSTSFSDSSTEMFIFIKPKIIRDPKEDLMRMREEILTRRPGDLDSLLAKIEESRQKIESRRFAKSMNLFFGAKRGEMDDFYR